EGGRWETMRFDIRHGRVPGADSRVVYLYPTPACMCEIIRDWRDREARLQQKYFTPGACYQLCRPAVEACEDRSAEPAAFECDHAIGKVPARIQYRQPGGDGLPIDMHLRAVGEAADSLDDLGSRPAVSTCEHPDELAQCRKRYGHDFRIATNLGRQ